MAERVCYRLAARSAFHIGERGIGLEETSLVLHSDTLFSALCLALRELGEDLDGFLTGYNRWKGGMLVNGRQTPFRLSSAFPFAGSVYFLPRPLLAIHGLDQVSDPRLGKIVKKTAFVSKSLFESLVASRDVSAELVQASQGAKGTTQIRQELLLQDGRAWVTAPERAALENYIEPESGKIRLWVQETQPRVTVDRRTNRSQVYAAGRVRFRPGAGFFTLVDYQEPGWRPKVEKALRILGETGIGGERSSGHGQFELQVDDEFVLSEPGSRADGFTSLALYWPAQPEVTAGVLENASYQLLNRRGWMASPDAMNLRRKSVRMLVEGSVFQQRPDGALVDVKPDDPPTPLPHDVWRYGLAFPVACRIDARKEDSHGE